MGVFDGGVEFDPFGFGVGKVDDAFGDGADEAFLFLLEGGGLAFECLEFVGGVVGALGGEPVGFEVVAGSASGDAEAGAYDEASGAVGYALRGGGGCVRWQQGTAKAVVILKARDGLPFLVFLRSSLRIVINQQVEDIFCRFRMTLDQLRDLFNGAVLGAVVFAGFVYVLSWLSWRVFAFDEPVEADVTELGNFY